MRRDRARALPWGSVLAGLSFAFGTFVVYLYVHSDDRWYAFGPALVGGVGCGALDYYGRRGRRRWGTRAGAIDR